MNSLFGYLKHHSKLLLRIGLLLSCSLGIFFQVLNPPSTLLAGWGVFKAFTIQSNIWISGWAFYLLLRERAGKTILPWMMTVKFMFTTSILLTYIVFAVFLSPFMELSYLVSPTNIFLHIVTPILALVDALTYDELLTQPPRVKLTALVMPLIYALLFIIVYEITNELPVPYFFLDYRLHGWFTLSTTSIGTFWWMIILLSILVIIARWLYPLIFIPCTARKNHYQARLWVVIMVVLSLLTLVPHLFF